MMELTKERLTALSNRENVGAICSDEIVEMARQLLAGMEQEPVAFIAKYESGTIHGTCDRDDPVKMEWLKRGMVVSPLYAAPQLPQPAVVSDVTRKDFEAWARAAGFNEDWYFFTNVHPNHYDDDHINDMWAAWNACRDDMLQGAEPVQNESPAQHWYLVSWRTAAGNFGHGDVNLDKPWSCGSARIAAGLIAETYPELQGQTVIIQSVMRIQPSECPPKQDESAQYPIICRSDERLMETPDITGETVKLIGSFNDDGFCHKHPMTAMRVHPLMQTASYPPQPAMYCPECEPRVAEWAERDKKLRNGKGV